MHALATPWIQFGLSLLSFVHKYITSISLYQFYLSGSATSKSLALDSCIIHPFQKHSKTLCKRSKMSWLRRNPWCLVDIISGAFRVSKLDALSIHDRSLIHPQETRNKGLLGQKPSMAWKDSIFCSKFESLGYTKLVFHFQNT